MHIRIDVLLSKDMLDLSGKRNSRILVRVTREPHLMSPSSHSQVRDPTAKTSISLAIEPLSTTIYIQKLYDGWMQVPGRCGLDSILTKFNVGANRVVTAALLHEFMQPYSSVPLSKMGHQSRTHWVQDCLLCTERGSVS